MYTGIECNDNENAENAPNNIRNRDIWNKREQKAPDSANCQTDDRKMSCKN